MSKTQTEIANEIGISKSYLCEILKGKKGCSYEVMCKIVKRYPNINFLDFMILNPRFILITGGEKNEWIN